LIWIKNSVEPFLVSVGFKNIAENIKLPTWETKSSFKQASAGCQT